MIQGF